MNELALFAGAGGGLLASKLLGWSTVGAVEIEQYPRDILMRRQEDGHLESFPIWDDVCTFDGRPWRGTVDVVSGGFPCQDISSAGRGEGLAGTRSRLWFEYLRIVDEVRPRFVFAENSPNLRTRGLGTVIEGLTSLGYNVRWCVLGAWHVGAPHKRDRMWVLAHAPSERQPQPGDRQQHRTPPTAGQTDQPRSSSQVPNADRAQREGGRIPSRVHTEHPNPSNTCWWDAEPAVGRVAHGVAARVDRLKAIGNGQVPAVAAIAWQTLSQGVA